MSLDNVLGVAAAAKGDMVLVVFGIALSLPIVVWGSGLLARLMARHVWIVWVGGGVLGFVAGEMMANDPIVERWLGHAADARRPVGLVDCVGAGFVLRPSGWVSSAGDGGERRPRRAGRAGEGSDGSRARQVGPDLRGHRPPGQGPDRRRPAQVRRQAAAGKGPGPALPRQPHLGARGAPVAAEPGADRDPGGGRRLHP